MALDLSLEIIMPELESVWAINFNSDLLNSYLFLFNVKPFSLNLVRSILKSLSYYC